MIAAALLLLAGGLCLLLPTGRASRARSRLAGSAAARRRGLRVPALGRRRATVDDAGAQLPLTAELLAACLAAGASPVTAAAAVGGSLDGALGEGLRRAAAELRIGGEPAVVWARLGRLPGTAALARQLELADTTGIPAVDSVTLAAAEHRQERVRQAQARIRRAGVYITGPLGLCFLPAFLLLGVAPMVIGLAQQLI